MYAVLIGWTNKCSKYSKITNLKRNFISLCEYHSLWLIIYFLSSYGFVSVCKSILHTMTNFINHQIQIYNIKRYLRMRHHRVNRHLKCPTITSLAVLLCCWITFLLLSLLLIWPLQLSSEFIFASFTFIVLTFLL